MFFMFNAIRKLKVSEDRSSNQLFRFVQLGRDIIKDSISSKEAALSRGRFLEAVTSRMTMYLKIQKSFKLN